MTTKEKQEKITAQMKTWQKLEDAAVTQTAKILELVEHPLIRAVMEIIQRDSQMHRRVQQLIVDSWEKERINVCTDELAAVWEAIEQHIQIERKTIELAQAGLAEIKNTNSVVQQYLLSYLLADEQKHDKLLADLDLIKRKMYPG
jgi:hypothetical protein